MEYLSGQELEKLVSAGYIWLKNKSKIVDDLNVFPVPDGDTGTNMCFALKNAVEEISKINDGEKTAVGEISKIIADGSLMGARGNSGVILSQFLYGVSSGINSKEKISISELAQALYEGSVYAYKSVSNPVEGTILTVMREVAQTALENKDTAVNLTLFFEKMLRKGKEVLNKTPEMLPVLKDAGVVDAGGCGFIFIIEGMLRYLKGKSLKEKISIEKNTPLLINIWDKFLNLTRKENSKNDELILQTQKLQQGLGVKINNMRRRISLSSINLPLDNISKILKKFSINNTRDLSSIGNSMVKAWTEKPKEKYCTEFILQGKNISKDFLFDKLKDMGSSIIIAESKNLLKVHIHIHTNEPEQIINTASLLGKVSNIKIDDMHSQQDKFLSGAEENDKDYKFGIVTVASGKGWKEIFKSFGASYIIDGRATMNPSVNEVLKGIEKIKNYNILLLPNNENILLSAQQAVNLTSKNVEIIPSKTMPEGVSSILSFNPEYSLKENKEVMKKALSLVTTGMVATSTRSIKYKDLEVKKGDFIGLSYKEAKEIVTRGEDLQTVTLDLINNLVKKDSKLITIYWGKNTNENKAKNLYKEVKNKFPIIETQLYYGGQLYYYYIISIE
ncbi:MAG TPA: hypothetical protein DCY00_07095 [Actinobacteria bacterium]|nr:hypothetical protein [Actinomycetota bacterium]